MNAHEFLQTCRQSGMLGADLLRQIQYLFRVAGPPGCPIAKKRARQNIIPQFLFVLESAINESSCCGS
jgi:hypothetical protein